MNVSPRIHALNRLPLGWLFLRGPAWLVPFPSRWRNNACRYRSQHVVRPGKRIDPANPRAIHVDHDRRLTFHVYSGL